MLDSKSSCERVVTLITKSQSFWSYLKTKQIDYFPAGKLRWWLLGLIILGWAVEQYEALKNEIEALKAEEDNSI